MKIKPDVTPTLSVAYHDGPPAISFFGMDWTRGAPREVTPMQWERMQLRGDFKEFDFRITPSPLPNPPPRAGEGIGGAGEGTTEFKGD
jgi:hypothetical protein